jgi:NAD+ synthase (glutamine-hydrolysing)
MYISNDNSSPQIVERVARLAKQVNSYHIEFAIDTAVSAVIAVLSRLLSDHKKESPRAFSSGGTIVEDRALQWLQNNIRWSVARFCSLLIPWCRGSSGVSPLGGQLLLLGSGTISMHLQTSASPANNPNNHGVSWLRHSSMGCDLDPIGALNSVEVTQLLQYAAQNYSLSTLGEFAKEKEENTTDDVRKYLSSIGLII